VDDLGFEAGNAGGEAVLGALVERDFFGRLHVQPGGLRVEHGEEREVLLMEEDGRSGDAFELRGAADVVDMRVGDDDLFERELMASEAHENTGDLVAGVDDDGLFTFQVREQGAVAAERADGEGFAEQIRLHVLMVARLLSPMCVPGNRPGLLRDY
jgi:hypothetical protein